MKILLVEDSLAIRQENERVLLKAGYEVVCAKDGESALKFAKAEHPELILLDMILPKMSGPEVLKQLKKDSATSNISVVVLSSLSAKNRQKLIEAGADEYLEKSTLSPMPGMNLLPKILEDVICRINRKRGIAFSSIPVDKQGVASEVLQPLPQMFLRAQVRPCQQQQPGEESPEHQTYRQRKWAIDFSKVQPRQGEDVSVLERL